MGRAKTPRAKTAGAKTNTSKKAQKQPAPIALIAARVALAAVVVAVCLVVGFVAMEKQRAPKLAPQQLQLVLSMNQLPPRHPVPLSVARGLGCMCH